MSNASMPDPALAVFLETVFERKPRSVTAIDVRALTSYAETLVIIEAASRRQVSSLSEHMISSLKDKKIKALGAEGTKEGEWALLDYGDTIIHIFETDARKFYNLEGLWADAPRIDLSGYGPAEEENGF